MWNSKWGIEGQDLLLVRDCSDTEAVEIGSQGSHMDLSGSKVTGSELTDRILSFQDLVGEWHGKTSDFKTFPKILAIDPASSDLTSHRSSTGNPFSFSLPETEPRSLSMLAKHSTTELCPALSFLFFKRTRSQGWEMPSVVWLGEEEEAGWRVLFPLLAQVTTTSQIWLEKHVIKFNFL